jgi:hypothetical protein
MRVSVEMRVKQLQGLGCERGSPLPLFAGLHADEIRQVVDTALIPVIIRTTLS